ncbi:MAG: chromosome segregation protein SMC [Oscillospiraceae bacterium]
MYLKALEIQGFKSFPDKTVLHFGEDITAIVGPNGSGKSNISDALLWVMGEQSSRSLRGSKMEDVIFGGTETRGQMGFAQVTLVMDNTGHIFPRDESEISVTRRYYRSGESEYYINRQAVRLRDVTELFMDTGMGREGYSIIGQGKIDEILSVKSGERREIFEEAAGISKFRHRKEEAERKLQRTEENLVRINDKISELELQVEPLRQQSEKAKRYLILRDETRVLEISLWLTSLESLRAAARKLETDLNAAEQELAAAKAAVEEQYAAGEKFAAAARENDLAAEELRRESGEIEGRISEKEAAAAVLATSISHNEESIRRVEEELKEQSDRAGGLTEKIEEQKRRMAETETGLAALEEALAALLQEAEELSRKAGSAAEEAEAFRAKEALANAEAAEKRAEQSALAAAIQAMEERGGAIDGDAAAMEKQLSETEAQAKQSRRALEDAEEEAAAVRNIIEGHALKLRQKQSRSEEAKQKALQLTMDLSAMDSRIHLLSEMEKEYEGFSKSVKTVMNAAAHGALRGVHGPVANLMETDQRYAVAMEIALGAGLQNIVVDREEDAKNAIALLKQRAAGRSTFLPLTAIRGEELREKGLERESGYVGIASELVRFEEKYRAVFLYLLGRTVVVEDLDCGIAMARKYQNRFRIVTLDGQVINRGGSMTGGSVSQSSGVLSRAGELKELTAKRQSLADSLAAAEKDAEEKLRELQRTQYELDTAAEQQRSAEDEVLRRQGEKNHYDVLLSAMRENLESLRQEKETLAARLAEARENALAAEERIADAERRAGDFRAEAERRSSGESELLGRGAALSEEMAAKKAEAAALSAEKTALEGALQNLQSLSADMAGDRSAREALIGEYRAKNEQLRAQEAERQAEAAALRESAAGIREKLQKLTEAKLQLEQERTAGDRRARECNELLLNAERSVNLLEQKKNASAMEEKQILDRLWEHYELSHSAAMEQRVELESVAKASRRVAELKREISALGSVNVGAIEEFERVNTRYTYLTDQRDDVQKSKDDLLGIIEEITREMTAIFSEQFKLLAESFQETFTELFGGGKATLELEDPEDILGCGIEIKAQPPGKSLKTISLLSGGEKAFVAIALYFSILKVHPTPFCVMDEIEAALDEPNVVRVAKYMRRISGKTQFVVITHRRGTMEEADVLYGVTMQEKGVSRVLTINMNDLAKELNIK